MLRPAKRYDRFVSTGAVRFARPSAPLSREQNGVAAQMGQDSYVCPMASLMWKLKQSMKALPRLCCVGRGSRRENVQHLLAAPVGKKWWQASFPSFVFLPFLAFSCPHHPQSKSISPPYAYGELGQQ